MERRKSFRYPASPQRQPAQLCLAGKTCAAILLDESTGGFRVSVENSSSIDSPWEPDQELLLQTYSGWHDVRIVRHQQQQEQVELGVLRLRDYIEEPENQASRTNQTRYRRAGTAGIGSEYLIGLAILFLVPLSPVLFQKFWNATPTGESLVALEESDKPHSALEVNKDSQTASRTKKKSPSSRKTLKSDPTAHTVNSLASGVTSQISLVGESAGEVLDSGRQTTQRILRETENSVREIISRLTPSQQHRLADAIDLYTASPNRENLDEVNRLLHAPEYSELEGLIDGKQVDTVELTSLLYAEFHQ